MKPYLRVAWNFIKYNYIKITRCHDVRLQGITLLGYNTRVSIKNTSHLYLGKKVISDGRLVMIMDHDASIEIGNGVYFNEGVMLSAKKKIVIGPGCQFGPNVKVFDNNHCFDKREGVQSEHVSECVSIGKNCWISANVTILKGTVIGDNCVIGASCVIKGKIPNGSVVTQENSLKIAQMR